MKKQILFFIFGIFLMGIISSAVLPTGGVSYCCEKTTTGAWCQNAPAEKCDADFRKVPTSCEATSYCKLGCCYDSQEGTCMENTPQKVCEDNNGIWGDNAKCEIPQCALGCCLIGDQAAFVTQTRCKRLSSLYGLEIDFRTSIQSEVQCIASATSNVKGACVFEKEFEKTCLFTTKRDCLDMKAKNTTNAEFHEGFLCSAEELGTICGPSEKTKCVEGKDEVYFVDTCGNLANIYDFSKIKSKEYWSKIYGKKESCNPSSSNANSKNCGNCDYFLGSTCKDYKQTRDKIKPSKGNYICRDLSCEYEGQKYQHGETWCADSEGISKITTSKNNGNPETENLPGSRYFRLVCYDGEVSVEPCEDFRNEICLQSEVNGFRTAGCIVNKWQDCYSQKEKKNCENNDRRDCQWIEGATLNFVQQSTQTGTATAKNSKSKGACVPKYSPGFDFWGVEETTTVTTSVIGNAKVNSGGGEAQQICSQATAQCLVIWKTSSGLLGGETKECVSGCECIAKNWEKKMNQACISLGDCGSKINYIGVAGFFNESSYIREEIIEEENAKK